MSNYTLGLDGLFTVSAPTMEELETLIARALELREECKAKGIAPVTARVNSPSVARMVNDANESKWKEVTGEQRMRMTREEKGEYGDNREECAKARLLAMGESTVDGDSGEGEGEGVTWEGNIDPSFVPED